MIRTVLLSMLLCTSAHAAEQRSIESPQMPLAPQFRPQISAAWMNAETYQNGKLLSQSSWMGLQAAGDASLFRGRTIEAGVYAQVFASVFGLSDRTGRSTAAEVQLHPFVLIRPGVHILGDLHLRASAGFFGNWRQSTSGQTFFPNIRAFQMRGEVSTTFDSRARIGAMGSYAFAEKGVLQAGGFFSQRVFGSRDMPWDIRLAFVAAVAKSDVLQENWTQFQIGIIGAL